MANSPDEEIVAQFTEITNVDHARAVEFLKVVTSVPLAHTSASH